MIRAGFPVRACAVPDCPFLDHESLGLHQGRQVTVHVVEVGQVEEGGALEQLDAATRVRRVVAQQALADFIEAQAGVVLVQEVRGLLELRRRVRMVGLDHPVLYLTVGEHEDDEHAIGIEGDEIDVAERKFVVARHADHADESRHFREQGRRTSEQGRRRRTGRQLASQLVELWLAERTHLEQAVDEDAIALRSRHAPGRGVRGGNEPGFLEIGQDVAGHGARHVAELVERATAFRRSLDPAAGQ